MMHEKFLLDELLTFCTTDIWSWGYPVCCRTFSSGPAFQPSLVPHHQLPSQKYYQMLPGGQNVPILV